MDESNIAHLLPQIINKPERITISDTCRVLIKCKNCKTINDISVRNLYRKWANKEYLCKSCHVKTYANDPSKIAKYKETMSYVWDTDEYKLQCSNNAKKLWQNKEFVDRIKKINSIDYYNNPLKQAGRIKATIAFMQKYGKEHLFKISKKGNDRIRELCITDKEFASKMYTNLKLNLSETKEKHRKSSRVASKLRWTNQAYRQKMQAIFAANLPKLVAKYKARFNDPDFIKMMNEKYWKNPKWLEANRLRSIEVNSRPEVRAKLAVVRSSMPSVSELEQKFAKILDSLEIKYKQQFQVGYYLFDFMIERSSGVPLLIEIQGDYWHNLPEINIRDRQKSTYINTYFNSQYELKYIWEHEFGCLNRIQTLLRYWTGNKLDVVDFDFQSVSIKNVDKEEVISFLRQYHYLSNIGRYGMNIGGYIDNKLVSVATFTSVVRNEIVSKQNTTIDHIKELSRFCIHPQYQKENFASWFLSRAMKYYHEICPEITILIAFSDLTFNHYGTIYKATNWVFDGEVQPSYWYTDKDGFVMHKKTLYNKAVNLKMTEAEFANKYNYQKVNGLKKFRYIFMFKDKDNKRRLSCQELQ